MRFKKAQSSANQLAKTAISNGPIKGINRKIKALKRIHYGFKNIDHFYARILLIVK
ncbi:transposase [Liquorilactobacillus vini]|uniref:transposase n=1 Tax=Liquorilactobacillus vini TaxID=238015 RepID=UPI0009DA3824|nr:transposase [Liquorilactobacillus vini]